MVILRRPRRLPPDPSLSRTAEQPAGSSPVAAAKPAAIALFAPHKTGSTFFVGFLHDLSEQLGTCLFTENAAFMYSPLDRSKCSSPACGHTPGGSERRYPKGDSGWGECTSFTDERLREAAACVGDARCTLHSATHGVVLGPVRLPPAMHAAARHARLGGWSWRLVLHQRHPLDTLVSEYHSYGWTHPAAPESSAQQRLDHEAKQSTIRNVSADEYVLKHLPGLRERYAPYLALLRDPPPGVVLVRSKYEEMVLFFPQWLSQILLQLQPGGLDPTAHAALRSGLLERHAAAFAADGRHKRGVQPGSHLRELRPGTIVEAFVAHQQWMGELGYT